MDARPLRVENSQLHWRVCSPSNSLSRPRAVASNLPRNSHSARRSKIRQEKEHEIKSACIAVHLHKPLAQTGEPHHSAAPAQRTDKDVFAPHSNTVDHKACAPGKLLQYKNMQESVSSRGRCADAIKTSSPRVRTVCHRMDIASHWTRHDIESLRMRVSAHRQLTSYFSRADFANDW